MLYQLSYFRKFLRNLRVSGLHLGKENKFSFLSVCSGTPLADARLARKAFEGLWEVVDSNHRTLRERIYSPPQLPLCEPPNN